MRTLTGSLMLVLLAGCTGDPGKNAAVQRSSEIPAEPRPPDWDAMRVLADGDVREGTLVRRDEGSVELHLRRGETTRPFLVVDPPDPRGDCWEEPVEEVGDGEMKTERQSAWWLFSDAEGTVALQFTADDVGAWVWNARRECAVRSPAIEDLQANDVTPPEYYKADDVQVGYRWNYTYQEETGPVQHEVDGDREIDLEVIDGRERLIVERDAVSILAEDGRALLYEAFEVSPEQPCYDSQLSIFEEPDGGLYTVISWESFGTPDSCEQTAGGNRYQSAIAEWRSPGEGFETTYRIDDQTRPLGADGEAKSLELEVHHGVLGGTLVLSTTSVREHREGREERCVERDEGTGTCLSQESCWRWESSQKKTTAYRFEARDGPTVPLGRGRQARAERVLDCAPLSP